MNLQDNSDNNERENILDSVYIEHSEKRKKRKEQRKELLKVAISELIHQIKVTILIIVIVSAVILFLCSAAWYILKTKDKKKSIIPSIASNSKITCCNVHKKIVYL